MHRWLDNTLVWDIALALHGTIVMFIVIFAGIFIACGKMPHELFGWKQPEELSTICHVWKPEICTRLHHEPGCRRTMMFNNSMAKSHIKHHKADYWGECQ